MFLKYFLQIREMTNIDDIIYNFYIFITYIILESFLESVSRNSQTVEHNFYISYGIDSYTNQQQE